MDNYNDLYDLDYLIDTFKKHSAEYEKQKSTSIDIQYDEFNLCKALLTLSTYLKEISHDRKQ